MYGAYMLQFQIKAGVQKSIFCGSGLSLTGRLANLGTDEPVAIELVTNGRVAYRGFDVTYFAIPDEDS